MIKTINLMPDSSLYWPDLGLTLDEHNDYVLLKKIIEHFYRKKKKFFSCEEVINFLKSNKKIRNINKIVKRKNNA